MSVLVRVIEILVLSPADELLLKGRHLLRDDREQTRRERPNADSPFRRLADQARSPHDHAVNVSIKRWSGEQDKDTSLFGIIHAVRNMLVPYVNHLPMEVGFF